MNMRELVLHRVSKSIENDRYEFPCGFEEMMKEENLVLPERYLDEGLWKENPNWIIEVKKLIPKMSDGLLLEVWEQCLCLQYR